MELAVLQGGEQLLATCRPVLLVEAGGSEPLARLANYLSGLGYAHARPADFMPWNHLFVSNGGDP